MTQKLAFIYFDNQWNQQFAYTDRFVIQVYHGLRVACYRDSYIAKKLFEGNFEKAELGFIHGFLRPSDTFVDIGANIGLHSLVAAYKMENRGKIFAFEPTPSTFLRLQENVELNQSTCVETFQLALSDSEGTFFFNESMEGRDAFNSFANIKNIGSGKRIEVRTKTMDAFFAGLEVKPGSIALMKIDVEGWEYQVLSGGKNFLSAPNAPVLMVEFSDLNSAGTGYKCRDVYDLGVKLGYSWYELTDDFYLVASPKKRKYTYDNLYAIKNLELAKQRIKESLS